MTTKIVLADDHSIVRRGVRAILENIGTDLKVVEEFSNGKELVDYADKNKGIGVFIVDIAMPILNGVEATAHITKNNPKANVIILSMYDDRVSVEKSLKAGAKGFVVKVAAADEILEAISEVLNGRFYLSKSVSKYIVQGYLDKSAPRKRGASGLTHKEKEILQLIAEGHSSKQIARDLNLSLNTVHVHRNNIMKKLNIHKQAELVRYALKEGIAQL